MPDVPDTASLYQHPPPEFVSARDDAVKALRAAGDRKRAAEVAKLRRPTPAAWALDRVAREAPDLVTRLLDAGDALRAATTKAMAGDASALRRAEADERSALDAVITRAFAEARDLEVRLSDAHRQRMAATLRAAVLDDSVRGALISGTLDSDHEAAPLGFDTGAAVASRASRKAPPRRTSAEAQAHRAELERLRQEAERLGKRAARLHDEAEEATRRAAELRATAKDAAHAARDADRKLSAAERRHSG